MRTPGPCTTKILMRCMLFSFGRKLPVMQSFHTKQRSCFLFF
jgi:hypothetical protein